MKYVRLSTNGEHVDLHPNQFDLTGDGSDIREYLDNHRISFRWPDYLLDSMADTALRALRKTARDHGN